MRRVLQWVGEWFFGLGVDTTPIVPMVAYQYDGSEYLKGYQAGHEAGRKTAHATAWKNGHAFAHAEFEVERQGAVAYQESLIEFAIAMAR